VKHPSMSTAPSYRGDMGRVSGSGILDCLLVFLDYFFLQHATRLTIDRMGNIFIGPIFSFLTRHRYEVTRGSFDDL
jgi:hypothetical protein